MNGAPDTVACFTQADPLTLGPCQYTPAANVVQCTRKPALPVKALVGETYSLLSAGGSPEPPIDLSLVQANQVLTEVAIC